MKPMKTLTFPDGEKYEVVDEKAREAVTISATPTANTKIQVNLSAGTQEIPTMEEFRALLRRVEALENR